MIAKQCMYSTTYSCCPIRKLSGSGNVVENHHNYRTSYLNYPLSYPNNLSQLSVCQTWTYIKQAHTCHIPGLYNLCPYWFGPSQLYYHALVMFDIQFLYVGHSVEWSFAATHITIALTYNTWRIDSDCTPENSALHTYYYATLHTSCLAFVASCV